MPYSYIRHKSTFLQLGDDIVCLLGLPLIGHHHGWLILEYGYTYYVHSLIIEINSLVQPFFRKYSLKLVDQPSVRKTDWNLLTKYFFTNGGK